MNNTILDELRANAKKLLKTIGYKNHDITITDSALAKLSQLYSTNSNQIVRLTIEGGGCNGFQYKFLQEPLLDVAINSKDILLVKDELPLIVFDFFSDFYIRGSTLDFEKTLVSSVFKIKNNPKAVSQCGCTKSFASNEFYEGEM